MISDDDPAVKAGLGCPRSDPGAETTDLPGEAANASLARPQSVPTPLRGFSGADQRRRELFETAMRGLNANTRRAYLAKCQDFARFVGLEDAGEAMAQLFGLANVAEANYLVLSYRHHLEERGLSPATIGLHLAALNKVNAIGRILGVCEWTLMISAPKAE
jgi:hypothetical protein